MNSETISESILADPIGNYPSATVACFDPTSGDLPRRRLDEPRNVQFLEKLAAAGAPAVLIAASTGHGHVRTIDELEAWFASSAEAQLGSTVKMALLRPEDGEAANARLLGRLKELGYPVVFVRPGTNLGGDATDGDVATNMQPIVAEAARLGFAVGVYSIPDVSGVRLTPGATVKLLDGPGGDKIVAVKVTENNYDTSTLLFLQHPRLAHLKIVQGWDPFMRRALEEGPRFDSQGRQRCGVTSGPMSFAVYQYMHILAAAGRGDWPEAEAAQSAVTAIFQAMQDDPQKFADLQRAKFIMGLGHPLTAAVSSAQVERVFAALAGIPRAADRARLARSLDLLEEGPFHARLAEFV